MAIGTSKVRNIWTTFHNLFFISRFLGIVPYSISEYNTKKIFKITLIGNLWSLAIMINNVVQYHFATVTFSLENEKETGTLTVAIGIFIIYMEPFMMVVDIIAGFINQRSLINCIERLNRIDEKLIKENIKIDYKRLTNISTILCVYAIVTELGNNLMNLIIFQYGSLKSIWFIVTGIPILTNSIARLWFIVIVYAVRQRFTAINEYFSRTKDSFEESRKKSHFNKNIVIGGEYRSEMIKRNKNLSGGIGGGGLNSNDLNIATIGYLGDEIFPKLKVNNQRNMNLKRNNRKTDIIQVLPVGSPSSIVSPIKYQDGEDKFTANKMATTITDSDQLINDKMDKKLILLCRLHDEICEIGKLCNKMYSFQMLITMAFGFMSITAQFYFLYCGLVKQFVPKLFQSSKSLAITLINITITSIKCISIIYVSWKTKLDAQKTGIFLHKIANVVDENHYYHIVNHLSLKLLNHQLNFTACGFFDLDMTTIYAITGAITSYLIILIQFNLAAQRTKKPLLLAGAPTFFNGTSTNNITSAALTALATLTTLIPTK